MDIVLWTVDPRDWKNKNHLTTLNSLSRQMKLNGNPKGGVVLLHDIYPSTVKVLGPFLDKLAVDDFQICSIDNSSSSSAGVSSKFWAATTPKISRNRISNNFDVELSGNQYLISFYSKKEVEISSIELLRARKTGQLMQFLIAKNL